MRSLQSVSKVSAAPRLKSVDDGYASDGFLDAGPLLMSVVKQNIDVAQAEEYRHAGDSDDSKEDDDDFGGQVSTLSIGWTITFKIKTFQGLWKLRFHVCRCSPHWKRRVSNWDTVRNKLPPCFDLQRGIHSK